MTDARTWTRPTAAEIRDLIHRMRHGRSLADTAEDIGERLGRSKRRVYYWMSERPKPGREIEYIEWQALKQIAEGDG